MANILELPSSYAATPNATPTYAGAVSNLQRVLAPSGASCPPPSAMLPQGALTSSGTFPPGTYQYGSHLVSIGMSAVGVPGQQDTVWDDGTISNSADFIAGDLIPYSGGMLSAPDPYSQEAQTPVPQIVNQWGPLISPSSTPATTDPNFNNGYNQISNNPFPSNTQIIGQSPTPDQLNAFNGRNLTPFIQQPIRIIRPVDPYSGYVPYQINAGNPSMPVAGVYGGMMDLAWLLASLLMYIAARHV